MRGASGRIGAVLDVTDPEPLPLGIRCSTFEVEQLVAGLPFARPVHREELAHSA